VHRRVRRGEVDALTPITQTGGGIEALEAATELIKAVRSVKLTLGVGVVLLAVVGALTLAQAPPRVVRVGVPSSVGLAATTGDASFCQANEVLPAGVSAIRLQLLAYFGAPVRVTASSGSQLLTEGRRGAGWTGTSVTVPVTPVSHAASPVTLCMYVEPNSEGVQFSGAEAPAQEAAISRTGEPLRGRVGVEYLAAGSGSWWSRITSVARNVGVGHALSGSWVALLIAVLTILAGALAIRYTLFEPPSVPQAPSRPTQTDRATVGSRSFTRRQTKLARGRSRKAAAPTSGKSAQSTASGKRAQQSTAGKRAQQPTSAKNAQSSAAGKSTQAQPGAGVGRWPADMRKALRKVPKLAWMCALIAFLNASAWSLLVPPFQGKDEADHFAYVEQIAENGTLPEKGSENAKYSAEETLVLEALNYYGVAHSPQTPAVYSPAQQRALAKDVHAGASLAGTGEAGVATSEPPLYYAIQTIPYFLGHGNILTQLQLMRLLGALFGAATALLTVLFLRELLPGAPSAATVGALCVALQPLFAFMSGSVNPDSMLFAVSAGVFLCLARAFRRGLTTRLAVVLGVLIAVGFLTKLNFIGLAFGVYVGLAALAVRAARSGARQALRTPAIAAGIGIAPVLAYGLRNLLTNRPTFGILSASINNALHLSYIWQLYLPRLPGMTQYFSGIATYKDIWFDRSVGLYGWMDTTFPGWVDNLALVLAVVVALLCLRELFLRRDVLQTRLAELGVYTTMGVGILVMVGASSYVSDIAHHGAAFGEPRYLLPMLPLLGAVLALAIRGAGRRWAPVVGGALVILFLGHDIFSQLQVAARYYG
jgi:hypothetical protein